MLWFKLPYKISLFPFPCPPLLFPLIVTGSVWSQWAAPSPTGASGQGGIRDGVRRVARERHRDGVSRPPRHLLHTVEVLRARGEERHSSCVGKEGQERFKTRKKNRFQGIPWDFYLFAFFPRWKSHVSYVTEFLTLYGSMLCVFMLPLLLSWTQQTAVWWQHKVWHVAYESCLSAHGASYISLLLKSQNVTFRFLRSKV